MTNLPDKYDHQIAEKKWQQYWQDKGIYHYQNDGSPRYVIDTPPPTVSGLLHMGHVFSYCQADFIARFQRMSGKDVFYPIGFDDNGLPTERLVEKAKGIKAHYYIQQNGRQAFIELCKEVVEEAELEFEALFNSIALSVDWRQKYVTISPHVRRLSQMSFMHLFANNHAYRAAEPMLWDPVDQTALAQADVEDKELESVQNYIWFGLECHSERSEESHVAKGDPSPSVQDDKRLLVMTTRPELLGACVAVMYHPSKKAELGGATHAITPLFGVKVPLIADEKVDPEKGTGFVMCCTFGDQMDIAWWREHKLPLRVILDKAGRLSFLGSVLSTATGISYGWVEELTFGLNNLKIAEARKKTIELLQEQGLIHEQKKITHAVKCAERSGAPLEIIVTDQWFVKVLDKKAELLEKADQVAWHPEYMKIRLKQWIESLSWDWCISRQRFFGVPFPVWYSKRAGEEGKILLPSLEQLPVDPLVDLPEGYSRDEVIADPDVMDTWATSSISPQISSWGISSVIPANAGIQHNNDQASLAIQSSDWIPAFAGMTNNSFVLDRDRHATLFPADLRPQAHEIIRTWAFYTLAKAHLHEDVIPWKNIMISGWCLAADKTKMSKSKGNVVTPTALIEEKGSDVVRYWASTSHLGADTAYSEDVFKIGKKLLNKLWNATKFAGIHLQKLDCHPEPKAKDLQPKDILHCVQDDIKDAIDQWILSRLHKAVKAATLEFNKYEYAKAREHIESFFWADFCDNYLELIKFRAYDEAGQNPAGQMSAVITIYYCLNAILKLFAPFMPHICEELFSHLFYAEFEQIKSLQARGTWPKAESFPYNEQAEKAGILCVKLLEEIRKEKSTRNLSIKYEIECLDIHVSQDDMELIRLIKGDLAAAANAKLINLIDDKGEISLKFEFKIIETKEAS